MPSSIELTQELVRFNTINPPGAERPCAERLAGLLESAGFAVELVPFGEGRAQIRARLGGTQFDALQLCDLLVDECHDLVIRLSPLRFAKTAKCLVFSGSQVKRGRVCR